MENIPAELGKIPPVTKFIVGSAVVVSVPVMLGVLSPYWVIFDSQGVIQRGEVWRVWSSWFYTPSSEIFLFIAKLFLFYRSSSNLETQLYQANSADYGWQMLLSSLAIMCLNIPLHVPLFSLPLLHFLVYRDMRNIKDPYMSIFDIFYIPKAGLPLILLALDLINGGPLMLCHALTGVIVAHASSMLVPKPSLLRSRPGASDKPLKGWRKYATAPGWVERILPDRAPGRNEGSTRPGGNVHGMNRGGGTLGFGYGLYNACAQCVG